MALEIKFFVMSFKNIFVVELRKPDALVFSKSFFIVYNY